MSTITSLIVCNWQCYLDRYGDLIKAFGANNIRKAETHWSTQGQKAGRDCTCGKYSRDAKFND